MAGLLKRSIFAPFLKSLKSRTNACRRLCTPARAYAEEPSYNKDESPVCSYNSWDPLEEVILGRPDGARVPTLEPIFKAMLDVENWPQVLANEGKPYEPELVAKAAAEADEFERILKFEGITVRRPDPNFKFSEMGKFRTPDFEEGGYGISCPRDSMIVIGEEIIEVPMAWRARHFETRAFRDILLDYFKRGAKWTCAPKPSKADECYDWDFDYHDNEKRRELMLEGQFSITEKEPMFDAADITRCGRDLFVGLSTVTNWLGVEWLKRHLEPKYRIHPIIFEDIWAKHIDATLVPLRPGLAIRSPHRPCFQDHLFTEHGWDILDAPPPVAMPPRIFKSSPWISINVLMLDEERVCVYYKEEPLIKFMEEQLGLKTVKVDWSHCFFFGGGLHCWTLDIKRKGTLQSYFDF